MTNLGINEWEALAFFGVEPRKSEPEEDWYVADSVYEVHHDSGLSLSCAIHPVHRDVRLRLSLRDVLLFEWHAMGLMDIRYVEDRYGSHLEFVAADADRLVLCLTPEFAITRHSRPVA